MVWSHSQKLCNVFIHLGDLHFTKDNFGVIGKLVTGSRFEDVVFQAGVIFPGSLNGVLAGSHYSRAWTVHSAFTKALERLLFERFIAESEDEIPVLLHHASQEPFRNNNEILREGETVVLKILKTEFEMVNLEKQCSFGL